MIDVKILLVVVVVDIVDVIVIVVDVIVVVVIVVESVAVVVLVVVNSLCYHSSFFLFLPCFLPFDALARWV